MSKAVKERRVAQRSVVTLNKLANGINTINQAKAKNDPIEKTRQQLAQRQATVNYGGIYGL